jgi:hypothetical protein
MILHQIEAYVIADYLMSAATRLRIHDPSIYAEARIVLSRYPYTPDVSAALDFLDAIERSREQDEAA